MCIGSPLAYHHVNECIFSMIPVFIWPDWPVLMKLILILNQPTEGTHVVELNLIEPNSFIILVIYKCRKNAHHKKNVKDHPRTFLAVSVKV